MLVFGGIVPFLFKKGDVFSAKLRCDRKPFLTQLVYRDVVFSLSHEGYTAKTGWWFQLFVIFTPIWGNDPS